MRRNEIYTAITAATGLSPLDSKRAFEAGLGYIIQKLKDGNVSDSFTITSFGTFSLREMKARPRRNPKTGASLVQPNYIYPHFRFSGKLKNYFKKRK